MHIISDSQARMLLRQTLALPFNRKAFLALSDAMHKAEESGVDFRNVTEGLWMQLTMRIEEGA